MTMAGSSNNNRLSNQMHPPASTSYHNDGSVTTMPTPSSGIVPFVTPTKLPPPFVPIHHHWLQSLDAATECLRKGRNKTNTLEEAEHALDYLGQLAGILKQAESQGEYDQAPTVAPPVFSPIRLVRGDHKNKSKWNNKQGNKNWKSKSPRSNNNSKDKNAPTRVAEGGGTQPASSPRRDSPTSVVLLSSPTSPNGKVVTPPSHNRFAMLEDDDASDHDEEEQVEHDEEDTGDDFAKDDDIQTQPGDAVVETIKDDDTHEAGDIPLLNMPFASPNPMVARRLMIRVVTAQSELYAYMASICRRRETWILGAQFCQGSLDHIHKALILADSEISHCLHSLEEQDMCQPLPSWNPYQQQQPQYQSSSSLIRLYRNRVAMRELLMEDANIVEVAVWSLTKERDSFVQHALQLQAALTRKLESDYISRNEIRLRWGEQKWKNNPRPKNSTVDRRKQHEEQLEQLRTALEHLATMDTSRLQQSTDALKQRLEDAANFSVPGPSCSSFGVAQVTWEQRFNRQRRLDLASRIDLQIYPDPSAFGWTFTGSVDGIECFEKQGMLLDFYYDVGFVELSWKPTTRKGARTVFYRTMPGLELHPGVYMEIMRNPRAWEIPKLQDTFQYKPKNKTNSSKNKRRNQNAVKGFVPVQAHYQKKGPKNTPNQVTP